MFDLGRTFLAAVERSPEALAIVDGERRLSYAAWYCEIGRVAGGLAALGLSRRDRLALILQNRLEMATLHWACQLAGIVVTPLNWRIKAEELDYCLRDADAGAIVFDEAAAAANDERQHQSLGYRTPRQIYQEGLWICGRSASPTGCV
jgi:2-furoate---CoA ligase